MSVFWTKYDSDDTLFLFSTSNIRQNGVFKCCIIECRSRIMGVVLDYEVWSSKIVSHNRGCRTIECRIIEVRLYI
jgi:hypothetical protein